MFNTKTGSQKSGTADIDPDMDAVRNRQGAKTGDGESGSLVQAIREIDEEELRRSEGKSKYADKIFTFLIDSYSKPIWNEEDAEYFKFSTPNAMRHFLRKYSSLYKDYRESMSNRLEETTKSSQFNRDNARSRNYSNLSIARSSSQVYHDIKNRVDVQELEHEQELRHFLKGNPEIDILEQYKKTYSYQGTPQEDALPVFDGKLHLMGDILLVGDIHIPSTNWPFMERITQIAKRHLSRPRKIAIVGDILNGDKDSRYEHIIAPISRHKEFKITDALLQTWSQVFDEIYMTPGNHLHRLIRRLEGDIGMNELTRLLTQAHEKVHMSHYDEVHVNSGDEHWVATHQINYAKSKLKIGNLLAQKYQANIITFHQHHSAIGRDDFNRYTIIDCGGMHRQDMMSYAQLVPNVMPNMNNGFVLLRDGTGHLLTPYPSITDWSMWV